MRSEQGVQCSQMRGKFGALAYAFIRPPFSKQVMCRAKAGYILVRQQSE
jgi:hypothetical protein